MLAWFVSRESTAQLLRNYSVRFFRLSLFWGVWPSDAAINWGPSRSSLPHLPPPSPTPPHPHSLVYPDAKRSHTHVKNTILKFRVRWIGNTKRTQQALKTKTHHTLRVQCQWQKEKERKRYKKPISWAVILTQLLLLCWLLKLCPSADRTPRVCLTKPAV